MVFPPFHRVHSLVSLYGYFSPLSLGEACRWGLVGGGGFLVGRDGAFHLQFQVHTSPFALNTQFCLSLILRSCHARLFEDAQEQSVEAK